jgi:hypothetical protein
MDLHDILRLSTSCMNVLQNRACDPAFEADLVHYADVLLSRCEVSVDQNFEAVILCMAKLVVTSVHCIAPPIFHQLFRAIVAFALHFYGTTRPGFSRFVSEWPQLFATNYVRSLFQDFLPQICALEKMVDHSLVTLLLFIYFSDDASHNPFLEAIDSLPEELFPTVFEPIKFSLERSLSALLLYTIMVFNRKFRSFAVSCVEVGWSLAMTSYLSKEHLALSELRLSIVLMLTEDLGFVKAISKSVSLPIVARVLHFLRDVLTDETMHQGIVTAIGVLANVGRRLSGIDTRTGDSLFWLVRTCVRMASSAPRFGEYARLLLLFVDSLVVHRARLNIVIIYEVLRNAALFQSGVDGVCEASDNAEECRKSVENLRAAIRYLSEKVIDKLDRTAGYEKVMHDLQAAVEGWAPAGFLAVRPWPVFEYRCHEFRQSVKFFRVMIVKQVQEMLSEAADG